MDVLVNGVEAELERVFDRADAVKLSVVRAHYRAVVANQLLTAIAKVAQRLFVQKTCPLSLLLSRTTQSCNWL